MTTRIAKSIKTTTRGLDDAHDPVVHARGESTAPFQCTPAHNGIAAMARGAVMDSSDLEAAGHAAPSKATARFFYVANTKAILQGLIGAVVILSVGYTWAWWTGRTHYVDATYTVITMASITIVPALLLWGQLRSARRAAATCGAVEYDDLGLRWRRPDASLGFDLAWSDVERTTVDLVNSTILVFRRDGDALLVGTLTGMSHVQLENFSELVELVNKKVTDALNLTKNQSFQNAAVLTALNFAEEMILLKRRARAELEKLEAKAVKLAHDLESSKASKVNWN